MVTYGLPILPLIFALGPAGAAPDLVQVQAKLRDSEVVLLIIVQIVLACVGEFQARTKIALDKLKIRGCSLTDLARRLSRSSNSAAPPTCLLQVAGQCWQCCKQLSVVCSELELERRVDRHFHGL